MNSSSRSAPLKPPLLFSLERNLSLLLMINLLLIHSSHFNNNLFADEDGKKDKNYCIISAEIIVNGTRFRKSVE